MDRTSGANYDVVGGKRMFKDGPPATCVEHVWLNGVQEEIVNVISAIGSTPNSAANTQLLEALRVYTAVGDWGAANAYAVTVQGYTAYASGNLTIEMFATHTNTGAATLSVNGAAAKNITCNDGTALVAGDIMSGGVYRMVFDGTNFQIIGSVAQRSLLAAVSNSCTGNAATSSACTGNAATSSSCTGNAATSTNAYNTRGIAFAGGTINTSTLGYSGFNIGGGGGMGWGISGGSTGVVYIDYNINGGYVHSVQATSMTVNRYVYIEYTSSTRITVYMKDPGSGVPGDGVFTIFIPFDSY